jgi:hypothetical protein
VLIRLPVESFPGAKRLTKKQCEIVEQLQIDGGEGVVYRWGFWSGCQVQTPSGSWLDAADVLERAIQSTLGILERLPHRGQPGPLIGASLS